MGVSAPAARHVVRDPPMPDTPEFGDPEDVLDDVPTPRPEADPDSGATAYRCLSSDTVKILRTGRTVTVDFTGAEAEIVPARRDEVVSAIEAFACTRVVIDMTGVGAVPAGFVDLLAAINHDEREIEVLNPSPAVQEALRVAQLDSVLMIRGVT